MPTERQLDIILESEVEFNSPSTYLPMANEIKLLRNNGKQLPDLEYVQTFYSYLQEKLSKKKAFAIIYDLHEHLPLLPDHIEQCSNCGELYDSNSQGHHSELTGKFYCCESCEPRGLYEREQRAEKKQIKKSKE